MSCLCNLESLKAVILRVILDPCCFLLPEIPSEEEEEAELSITLFSVGLVLPTDVKSQRSVAIWNQDESRYSVEVQESK